MDHSITMNNTLEYYVLAWYADQMGISTEYLLYEFFIDGDLIVPEDLVPYDYES